MTAEPRAGAWARPTDRVAVMPLNSRAFMELYHTAYLGGFVTNPLNLRFAPKELEFVIRDSASKVICLDFLFAGVIDKIRVAAGIEKVALLGEPGTSPAVTTPQVTASIHDFAGSLRAHFVVLCDNRSESHF